MTCGLVSKPDRKMSKITQKMVKEVKANNKKTWHDAAWHEFNNRKETEAVNFALSTCERGSSLREIAAEAERYIANMEE